MACASEINTHELSLYYNPEGQRPAPVKADIKLAAAHGAHYGVDLARGGAVVSIVVDFLHGVFDPASGTSNIRCHHASK
jgi:hypothetical protein